MTVTFLAALMRLSIRIYNSMYLLVKLYLSDNSTNSEDNVVITNFTDLHA